jgi:hypothetical protein
MQVELVLHLIHIQQEEEEEHLQLVVTQVELTLEPAEPAYRQLFPVLLYHMPAAAVAVAATLMQLAEQVVAVVAAPVVQILPVRVVPQTPEGAVVAQDLQLPLVQLNMVVVVVDQE